MEIHSYDAIKIKFGNEEVLRFLVDQIRNKKADIHQDRNGIRKNNGPFILKDTIPNP